MATSRDLLDFRHHAHYKLEGGDMTDNVSVRCRCGQWHRLQLKEGALITIHCKCGKSTEVMLEKPKKAA